MITKTNRRVFCKTLTALIAISAIFAPSKDSLAKTLTKQKEAYSCSKAREELTSKEALTSRSQYKELVSSAPKPSDTPVPFKAGTQSTTLQTGTQSTLLETGAQSNLIQGGAEGTLIQGNIEKQEEPVNILFLMDASQSMKESLAGGLADLLGMSGGSASKMEAAKKVLENTIARIPNDVNVGLRVFGQAFRNDPATDCQQTVLLVPLGRGNRRSIIEKVRQLRPHGLTPLTYALREAAERDLRYVVGTKTIILISDGAETCGGDPCAYIERLTQIGIKLKINIVGVGLKHDREAKEQLNCIAEVSGGKFYDANTAAELVDSMSRSVKQAISGKVLTKPKQPPAINTETLLDTQPTP